MQKTVLITGVSGFAGRYLAPIMAAEGYRVFGTTKTPGSTVAGVERLFCVDLQDCEALEGLIAEVRPDRIVHLAALSFVGHSNAKEIYDTNIVGTRNLLEALRAKNPNRCVAMLVSSATVYGNASSEPLDENSKFSPANDYAVSKMAMELMAAQFQDSIDIIIARPFNYTGRSQNLNFLVPKIVDHFYRRESFIELGNTNVARDFSDVRDVVECMRLLLEAEAARGQTFNICSGVSTSLQKIIEICQNICGYEIEIRSNVSLKRASEVKYSLGDNSKLIKTIGRCGNYNIHQTVNWMLQANDG